MEKIFNDMIRSLNEKINSLNSASKELDKRKYLELVNIIQNCIYNGIVSDLDVDTFLHLRNENIERILNIINLNDEEYDEFIYKLDKYRNDINNSHNANKVNEAKAQINNVINKIKAYANKFDSLEQNEIKSFGSQIEKCEAIIEILDGSRHSVITATEFDMYRNFLKNNGFSVKEQFAFVKKCSECDLSLTLDNNIAINYEYSINRLVNEYYSNDEYRRVAQEYIENNVFDIHSIDEIAEELAIQEKLDKPIIKNTLIAMVAHDLFIKSVQGKDVSIEDIKYVLDGEEIIKVDHLRKAKEILKEFDYDKDKYESIDSEDRTTIDLIANENLSYTQAHNFRYVPLYVKLSELVSEVSNLDKTSDSYEEDYELYVNLIKDIVDTIPQRQSR